MEEAIDRFAAALRLRPDYAVARYNLGLALDRLSRRQEAIAAYREAIRLQAGLKEPHLNLAIALYSAGDFAGAWGEVRAFQQLGGTPPPEFLQALSRKTPPPP